jgi:hypothetical protein
MSLHYTKSGIVTFQPGDMILISTWLGVIVSCINPIVVLWENGQILTYDRGSLNTSAVFAGATRFRAVNN